MKMGMAHIRALGDRKCCVSDNTSPPLPPDIHCRMCNELFSVHVTYNNESQHFQQHRKRCSFIHTVLALAKCVRRSVRANNCLPWKCHLHISLACGCHAAVTQVSESSDMKTHNFFISSRECVVPKIEPA